MKEYILLMHNDCTQPESADAWQHYISGLCASGAFEGGSSIGAGACYRKDGSNREISKHVVGYMKLRAPDYSAARELLKGNPVFDAGGTVEIRELIRD